MDQLTKIRNLLTSQPARQVKPGIEVWDLDTSPWWKPFIDHRNLERIKSALLAAAWELSGPLFLLPHWPPSPELVSFLTQHQPGLWMVNREFKANDFYGQELKEGNWMLYSAPHPIATAFPNTFKTTPQELIAFLHEHRITLLIDSFYDDMEWRVALGDPQLVDSCGSSLSFERP